MNVFRRMILVSALAIGSLSLPAVAADVDVTGSWTMNVELQIGSGSPVFELTQKGADVSGTYKGQLGEAPVTGKVKGNDVELQYTLSAQGMELTVTYAGTVEGNSIKGKVLMGELGEGTFTGTKQ
jgi:hypothetical protein